MSSSPPQREVDGWILAHLKWQAFGSLTFRKEANTSRAVGLFLRIHRRAEALWRCRGEGYWMLRFERGEVAGREHAHFLVGGFPSRHHDEIRPGLVLDFFDVSGCLWWVREWVALVRGGWARIRPYEAASEHVLHTLIPYLLKGLSNRYENERFSGTHFSASLVEKLTALQGSNSVTRFGHQRGGASGKTHRADDETECEGQVNSSRGRADLTAGL